MEKWRAFSTGADGAVHTRAGGQQQLAAKVNGFGNHGDERVAISCYGAADPAQEREMNLRALHDLTRLARCGRELPPKEMTMQFSSIPPART